MWGHGGIRLQANLGKRELKMTWLMAKTSSQKLEGESLLHSRFVRKQSTGPAPPRRRQPHARPQVQGGGRGELPMGRHCRGDPHNQAVLARFREPHHSEGTSHCTPAVPASGSRCRGVTRGGKGAAQDPHDLVGMGERESSGMVPPQCHAGQPRQERQPRFRFRRLLGPWFQSGLSHRQGHRALAPLPLLPLTSACSLCSPCAPLACSPCSLCVRR